MSTTTQKAAVMGYYQPPIPLIHPDTGEKVKLKLRKMSFNREISTLPAELLGLHELLIKYRSNRNADIYMMVAVWNKLRVYEKFWESFHFPSETDYLAFYGLPDGTTLASLTIMVCLFDKATFVLLGEEVLSYMIRAVGRYEPDTDERKKAYQAIFDRYCSLSENFDKTKFYDTIKRYVIETYEEPAAKEEGVKVEEWRKQQYVNRGGGSLRRTVTKVETPQEVSPKLEEDFEWEVEHCPHCLSKLTIIKAFQIHTEKLEAIIRQELGDKALPERPLALKNLPPVK